MLEYISYLQQNSIAFAIELLLLILVGGLISTTIKRLSDRITPPAFLKLTPEMEAAFVDKIRKRIWLFIALSVLVILITNLAFTYLKIDSLTEIWTYLKSISRQDMINLGIIIGKIIGLAIAGSLLQTVALRIINWLRQKLAPITILEEKQEELTKILDYLQISLRYLILFGTLILIFTLINLSPAIFSWFRFVAVGFTMYAFSRFLSELSHLIIDILFETGSRFAKEDNALRYLRNLQHLSPITQSTIDYLIYVGAGTVVFAQIAVTIAPDLGTKFIRTIAIFFISRVVIEICSLLITELFLRPEEKKDIPIQTWQQRQTLAPLILSLIRYAVYFSALIMVLETFEIQTGPLLAGAGVLGITIGLGAQTLVMDILSGFFILFENLFLVGDFIETAGIEGYVEEIGVRITKIRDREGRLHAVPNGEIRQVASHSKEYVNAIVSVGIAYEADINEATKLIKKIGLQMHKDQPDVLAPTVIVGVVDLGESDVVIRTATRVKPNEDYRLSNHLRQKIKEAFDEQGIEIPYARRVVIHKFDGPLPPVAKE